MCSIVTDFAGCRLENDRQWDIIWANTPYGEMDVQRCPIGIGKYMQCSTYTFCASIHFSSTSSYSYISICCYCIYHVGFATRRCSSSGWLLPNVMQCDSFEFMSIRESVSCDHEKAMMLISNSNVNFTRMIPATIY